MPERWQVTGKPDGKTRDREPGRSARATSSGLLFHRGNMMRVLERIEMNRQRAKDQRRADRAVEWALVESFGMAGFKAAYERCLQSERFPALCSLAVNTPQYSDTWPQVVAFAKTLANNPRSRSSAYRKAVRGCRHNEVSLATTSDPDTVCADCGEILQNPRA